MHFLDFILNIGFYIFFPNFLSDIDNLDLAYLLLKI